MRINLKLLRVANGMTQENTAEKVGVTRQTYASIENGATQGKEDFWKAIQNLFNVADCDMWEVIQNVEQPPSC